MSTKYIVIELQTSSDGSIGNIVTAFDDRRDADAKFHSILAAAAKSGLPAHAACLMTSQGYMLRNECYTNGEQTPETL